VSTPKLLWPPALCVALALALPATALARPSARYVLRPSSPVAGQPTTFDASPTACDLRPCTYRWSRVLRARKGQRLRSLGRGKILTHTFRRSGVRYFRLIVRNRKRQKSSRTRRIVVANAPAPAPPPAAPPPTATPAAGVSLEQVDGGPGFYGRFANPLPTDPGYFTIGVWLQGVQTQGHVDNDKDFGVNTYVGVADPEGSNKALLRANGMKAFIQADERTRFRDIGSETAGWMLADEIDMTQGPSACTGSLQTIKNALPADGSARYSNYGKGVLLWETDAEAACFVEAQDLQSTDLYWFTDPNQTNMIGEPWLPEGERQMTLSEVRRASNYGYQVDRMRALDARNGEHKPIWNFVELGWPWSETAAQGGRSILPQEIRAAVWHSIIAGARGIIYFDHNFNGPCGGSTLRGPCYPENRAMAKSVNALIRILAPVLNAPTVVGGASTSPSIRSMVKWQGGHFYVFAGSRNNQSSTGTVSIPCVGNATAVRLGEAGSVPVSDGSFSDQFTDGNAIHIYRIDGGSTCGLTTDTLPPAPGVVGPPDSSEPPKRDEARVGRLPRRVSLHARRLAVPVTCVAPCRVRSRLTMRRASRWVVLAAHQRRFGPGRHKLILRLSKRDRRRLARAHRPRNLRVHTVIVEPRGAAAQRTQRLVIRRR
jgi:hypothetical protein